MAIYFGDKIRAARKAAHLTQKDLADKLNVKNTTISNWEKDISRPDPDMIAKLCGVLGITPADLFGLSGENEKTPAQKSEGLTELQRQLWDIIQRMDEKQIRTVLRLLDALRGQE